MKHEKLQDMLAEQQKQRVTELNEQRQDEAEKKAHQGNLMDVYFYRHAVHFLYCVTGCMSRTTQI